MKIEDEDDYLLLLRQECKGSDNRLIWHMRRPTLFFLSLKTGFACHSGCITSLMNPAATSRANSARIASLLLGVDTTSAESTSPKDRISTCAQLAPYKHVPVILHEPDEHVVTPGFGR